MEEDYENLKVGDWAFDEHTDETFIISEIGEDSVDTDEGVGYFDAIFDESHFGHVNYHCRPATVEQIENECAKRKLNAR